MRLLSALATGTSWNPRPWLIPSLEILPVSPDAGGFNKGMSSRASEILGVKGPLEKCKIRDVNFHFL